MTPPAAGAVAAGGLDAADPYGPPPLPPDELPEGPHAARATAPAAAAGSASSNRELLSAFNLESGMVIVPPAFRFSSAVGT